MGRKFLVLARVTGAISCIFFGGGFTLSFIVGGPPDPAYIPEMAPMITFLVVSIIGYVIQFFKKKYWGFTGGAMMFAGGTSMGTYLILLKGLRVFGGALMFCLPFLLPGLLMMIHFHRLNGIKSTR